MQMISGKTCGRLYCGTAHFSFFSGWGALLVLCFLLLPSSLRAQQMTADVLGTVSDPSGAALANVKVTVRNLGTNDDRSVATDDRGDYTFNLLPVGHYSLKVEAPGFKSYQVKDFQISVGDRFRINAKLDVGAVSESVVVTSGEAPLQTDTATVGSTLDETTVQDLPLNGRNFMGIIDLTAGVQGETATGSYSYLAGGRADDRRTGDTISANGKSEQLNNNEVDGFDNNDRAEGNIGLRPSLDGIQEVKVDTSSYNADSGRTAGAISNVITKSGTNSLHGSAYEYLRNDKFDAWEYFIKQAHLLDSTVNKPELRLNEFGGSLGAPVVKNKTFFFGDIEEDRMVQGITYPVQMPSKQELTPKSDGCYDFSDVGGSNDVCPVGTIAKNYWSLFPVSRAIPVTGSGANAQYEDVQFEPNKVQNSTTVDARLDHQFNSSNLFFARYAYNPVFTAYPGPFPEDATLGVFPNGNLQSAPGNANAVAQQLQLTYTHIFSYRMIGELKAGYTRINIQSLPPNADLDADSKLGFPAGTYDIPGLPSTNGMSAISLGSNNDSAYVGDPPSEPIQNKSNNYQYLGTVTYTRGAHNLKFGAGTIRRQIQFIQTGFPAGFFIMIDNTPAQNFQDTLQDLPGIVLRMVEMIKPLYETSEPSFYALDNWRVSNSLTLNLGLRYEIFTPYSEAHNQYTNFDLNTLNFITGGKLGVKTDYTNVSPRVGFAQSIGKKTVLRGAFGMSYFPPDVGNIGNGPNLVQMANPPYFFNYGSSPGPGGQCPTFEGTQTACYPNSPGAPGFLRTVVGLPIPTEYPLSTWTSNPQITEVFAKDRNLRSSYLEQWNLSLQREFGANSVTLAYVGDIGQALLRQVNADEPMPVACTGIYNDPNNPCDPPPLVYSAAQVGPSVNQMIRTYNGSSENYHALQLVFSRHAAKGLTAGANYVWAHGLTNATFGRSNITAGMLTNDSHYDYGNSDLDVRNRVTFHATYDLPFAASAHGMNAVLAKGWQANVLGYWQSGMPQSVVSQVDLANGLSYINLPNVTGGGANLIEGDRPNSTGHYKLSKRTASEWFDVSAFSPQAIGTAGNEGVNQVPSPPDRRLDFSLLKDFTLRENLKLQFRAECFNLTNTENFSQPTAIFTNWTTDSTGKTVPSTDNGFGSITSTAFSENPRQFQFALKLLF
jgi:hypothetical protein